MPPKPTRFLWLQQAIKSQTDNCILWPFPLNQDGYGKLRYLGKKHLAHRLAFWITYEHWPFPEARHTCDVRNCINPRHIIEGTHDDNMRDMAERDRALRGTRSPNAKITDDIVRLMRAEYVPNSRTHCCRVLAEKYGLDGKNVYNIVMRRAWRHVD